MSKFQITIEKTFAASHALRLPDGSSEPVHWHDWPVSVSVSRDGLDQMETVMDFHELDRLVDQIIGPLHNHHLNDAEPFSSGTNPSAERVAWWIGTRTAGALPDGVSLVRVSVGEAPGCYAVWNNG